MGVGFSGFVHRIYGSCIGVISCVVLCRVQGCGLGDKISCKNVSMMKASY